MAHKRKSANILWIIVFAIVVGVAGYVLASTGHFDNPFRVFAQSGEPGEGRRPVTSGGEQSSMQGSRRQNAPSGGAGTRAEGNVQQGGFTGQTAIAWSQLGDVLFNVWFLFAVTAVVIIVQKAAGYLIRRARQRITPLSLT